jgi:hypothetical protein
MKAWVSSKCGGMEVIRLGSDNDVYDFGDREPCTECALDGCMSVVIERRECGVCGTRADFEIGLPVEELAFNSSSSDGWACRWIEPVTDRGSMAKLKDGVLYLCCPSCCRRIDAGGPARLGLPPEGT